MPDLSTRCSKRIYDGSGFTGHLCMRQGALEFEGQKYCKQHYPPNANARLEARTAKWKSEWDAKDRAREEASALQVELMRKAAAYDRLVAWLDHGADDGAIWIRQIRESLEGEC